MRRFDREIYKLFNLPQPKGSEEEAGDRLFSGLPLDHPKNWKTSPDMPADYTQQGREMNRLRIVVSSFVPDGPKKLAIVDETMRLVSSWDKEQDSLRMLIEKARYIVELTGKPLD